MDIPVLVSSGGEHKELEKFFRAKLISEPIESYYLCYEKAQWIVRNPKISRHFTLQINFEDEINRIRKQKISVKKDSLCRAVGYKGGADYTVLDGTLGFAKDSLHLLAQGAKVIGFERNPVVYTLLKSALERARTNPSQFSIHFQDVQKGLEKWQSRAQCLYLDPMFDEINEKSAPKKNMAFLRQLELQEGSVEQIIEKACQSEVPRVVVKRPAKADYLYKKPNSIVEGKIVRYDIYLR